MITLSHIDVKKPPKPTKFLKRRVLCGLCRFRCCNSPSLEVECTPEESMALGLPQRFPQEGRCRCLGDEGCTLGDKRPVFCKIFPIQISPTNAAVTPYWSILNCPVDTDYEYKEIRDGRYVYQRKSGVSGARRNNSHEELMVPEPLDKWPTVAEMYHYAVELVYGRRVADYLRDYATEIQGFGL